MDDRRRRWIRTTLWVGVAGLAVLVWFDLTRRMDVRPPDEAPPATELAWIETDGSVGRLAELRGEVVVLSLWASWCPPCRTEIPMLARLQRDYGERGLVVVGINVEDLPTEDLARLAGELGADYRVGIPASELRGPFADSEYLPQTWLVDRRGRVRGSHAGAVTYRSLRRAAERLLDEGG